MAEVAKTMVTITYVHDHKCSYYGQEHQERLYVRDGAYTAPVVMCVDWNVELTRKKVEVI